MAVPGVLLGLGTPTKALIPQVTPPWVRPRPMGPLLPFRASVQEDCQARPRWTGARRRSLVTGL